MIQELKKLYKSEKINKQEYKTYRGQVLHGDVKGCIKGLERKRLTRKGGENGKT